MLLAMEQTNEFYSSNKLGKLYLIQEISSLIQKIDTDNIVVKNSEISTVLKLISNAKDHYMGKFIEPLILGGAETYSLITSSFDTKDILDKSFIENTDNIMNLLTNLPAINEIEKNILVRFLSNLITHLNINNSDNTRNFFDW